MADAILHLGALVNCPHAPGVAVPVTYSMRVKVQDQNVVAKDHPWLVGGCSRTGSTPACVNGAFTSGAQKVKVEGRPVATMASNSKIEEAADSRLIPKTAQTRVLVE